MGLSSNARALRSPARTTPMKNYWISKNALIIGLCLTAPVRAATFSDQALALPADVFPNQTTVHHTADVFARIGRFAADSITPRIWTGGQDQELLRTIQMLMRGG